jgi:nitrite reductase/ring-hydroxylating ferredoxin subunit
VTRTPEASPDETGRLLADLGEQDVLALGELRRMSHFGKTFVLVRAADGGYYALRNTCPHQGADLADGALTGRTLPSEIGEYRYKDDREILRCARHGYEFDVTTGRCWFDPGRMRVKTYDVKVETYPVEVSGSRVVVDLGPTETDKKQRRRRVQ